MNKYKGAITIIFVLLLLLLTLFSIYDYFNNTESDSLSFLPTTSQNIVISDNKKGETIAVISPYNCFVIQNDTNNRKELFSYENTSITSSVVRKVFDIRDSFEQVDTLAYSASNKFKSTIYKVDNEDSLKIEITIKSPDTVSQNTYFGLFFYNLDKYEITKENNREVTVKIDPNNNYVIRSSNNFWKSDIENNLLIFNYSDSFFITLSKKEKE